MDGRNKLMFGLTLLMALYLVGQHWDVSQQLKSCVVQLPSRQLRHPLDGPDPLIDYNKFRDHYGDILGNPTKIEYIRREMSFISDSLRVAWTNMAYLLFEGTFLAQQSPLKSDRFHEELTVHLVHETLSVHQSHLAVQNESNLFDVEFPIGASGSGGLEKAGVMKRLFGRGKMSSSYEIPNFALDQQPNPEQITHIDADLRACFGPSQNQKTCNACYAFSWLGYVEWHYCKQADGKLIDFSEQHIIDCGHVTKLQGCKQGYLKSVRLFSHMYGLYLEKDYPFRNKQEGCDEDDIQGKIELKTTNYNRLEVDREQWEKVLEEQPILVEVHLPRDILSYSRGIHPGHNCDSTMAHGMVLAGHGRQNGKPYWLLRNSLGPRWGEGGYFRLSRDLPIMDKCLKTGFISKLKFSDLDEDNHDAFYESLKFRPRLWKKKTNDLLKWAKGTGDDQEGDDDGPGTALSS